MASVSILIDSNGNVVNSTDNNLQPVSGGNLVYNTQTKTISQISLAFYNDVITLDNGYKIVDRTTKVDTGLSGTLTIEAKSFEDSPYPITITGGTDIDISTTCIVPFFQGTLASLIFTTSGLGGCNYVLVIVESTNV
jgi:hypothetical protein